MKISKSLKAGISKQVREYKNSLVLTEIQKEILLGVTLGDVTIRNEGKLKFEQKYDNKQYVEHLYEIFREYVNVPPQVRKIVGGGAKDRYSIWFQTFTHPAFKVYRDIFYKQKVDEVGMPVFDTKGSVVFRKSICDVAFLEKWLTPRAIAYWFMDDGSYIEVKGVKQKYTLCTHGFNEEENIILCSFLNRKFNLNTKVCRDVTHFYISIPKADLLVFRSLVEPFVISCFIYKL